MRQETNPLRNASCSAAAGLAPTAAEERRCGAPPLLHIPEDRLAALLRICRDALPDKAFGMLSGPALWRATEIHPMARNLREQSSFVNRLFEQYGEFYHDRSRGFCFDPLELAAVERRVRRNGQRVVGVFHSHRCRHAEPSQIDVDLHYAPDVLSVIVSVVNPASPDVRIYRMGPTWFERGAVEVERPLSVRESA